MLQNCHGHLLEGLDEVLQKGHGHFPEGLDEVLQRCLGHFPGGVDEVLQRFLGHFPKGFEYRTCCKIVMATFLRAQMKHHDKRTVMATVLRAWTTYRKKWGGGGCWGERGLWEPLCRCLSCPKINSIHHTCLIF